MKTVILNLQVIFSVNEEQEANEFCGNLYSLVKKFVAKEAPIKEKSAFRMKRINVLGKLFDQKEIWQRVRKIPLKISGFYQF